MESHKNCKTTTWAVNEPGQKQAVSCCEAKKTECGAVQDAKWRRHCGCIRTSEKLKQILTSFPSPPPPSPATVSLIDSCCAPPYQKAYISTYRVHEDVRTTCNPPELRDSICVNYEKNELLKRQQSMYNKSWIVVTELVQLVQLSVTATALALYYLIYCYMQLIYLTLRSALYFHNADGPMKITIGVVTVTSLIIGINLIIRMERLLGFII